MKLRFTLRLRTMFGLDMEIADHLTALHRQDRSEFLRELVRIGYRELKRSQAQHLPSGGVDLDAAQRLASGQGAPAAPSRPEPVESEAQTGEANRAGQRGAPEAHAPREPEPAAAPEPAAPAPRADGLLDEAPPPDAPGSDDEDDDDIEDPLMKIKQRG